MRRLKRLSCDQTGATAVEFGLTAPVFFAVIFGIIECGFILWTQLGLQHAAEMAVRCASINKILCGSTADIQNYAVQQAYGLSLPPSTFSVGSNACGTVVSASYQYNFFTSYVGTPSLTLTAQSCFPT